MNYCDVHNHLLPSVDDGSTSVEETVRHLRAFRVQGVTDLVFTPHLLAAELGPKQIDRVLDLHRSRFAETTAALEDLEGLPRLHLGQEVLARRPADLARVVDRPDVGLAGGATLLVEFGFRPGFDAEGVIRLGLASGRPVIVAHPERYAFDPGEPAATVGRIATWRALGSKLQVNVGSALGRYTPRAADLATRLLDEGLVDLVATDHHGDHRDHPARLVEELAASRGWWASAVELYRDGPRQALFGRHDRWPVSERSLPYPLIQP